MMVEVVSQERRWEPDNVGGGQQGLVLQGLVGEGDGGGSRMSVLSNEGHRTFC